MNFKIYNLIPFLDGWRFILELTEYGMRIDKVRISGKFDNLQIPGVGMSITSLIALEKQIAKRIEKFIDAFPKEI